MVFVYYRWSKFGSVWRLMGAPLGAGDFVARSQTDLRHLKEDPRHLLLPSPPPLAPPPTAATLARASPEAPGGDPVQVAAQGALGSEIGEVDGAAAWGSGEESRCEPRSSRGRT